MIKIINTIMKKKITAFCKESLLKNCISIFYKIYRKYQENKLLVRLLGFEPRTSWSVAKCSIQLSYRHIIYKLVINQKGFY